MEGQWAAGEISHVRWLGKAVGRKGGGMVGWAGETGEQMYRNLVCFEEQA